MKKIAPRSLLYLSVLPCGMCGTQAKSCVTVRVARPRGWGTGIRSTDHDKVLRVRHGPSMHTVHNNTHATVHCCLACSDAGQRHTAPTTARASGPGKKNSMQAHTRARTHARTRTRAYTSTCTRTRARAHTHTHTVCLACEFPREPSRYCDSTATSPGHALASIPGQRPQEK